MKVWIVCDNNSSKSITVYDSSEKAEKHTNQYDSFKSEDCWILDKNGTEVE
ncbi:MAG: hypothetical protein ACFFCM_16475 [Promethearchaeota archaeon]